MDSHLNPSLIFLLLCCIVATIAYPACCEILLHETKQPRDFPNEQLYHAYLVIQRFKSTITSDPKNITATWTGTDLCAETMYVGFYCGSPLGRDKLTITAIILDGYNLHAPKLQGFIDQFPDLALFHATSNNFGVDIPRLAGLGYVYKLGIRHGDLPMQTLENGAGEKFRETLVKAGGNFKVMISSGGNTVNLYFGIGVKTPGSNAAQNIQGLTDAKALLLNHNNLLGPLPANIGFSKLSYLALANNKLTGPIPSSIEHLQDSLFEVLLLNNQLSGCLPHELGMLHKAAVIDAGANQLTGPIPQSFSCLRSVEQLNLAGNRLYGEVPNALCKLAGPAGRLANLTLSGNYFTSVGPACAALIRDGVLDVKNNCIPGLANQRRPAECAAFQSQPKTCPASTTTAQVACPAAAAATNAAATAEKAARREYPSYVTYATLHD